MSETYSAYSQPSTEPPERSGPVDASSAAAQSPALGRSPFGVGQRARAIATLRARLAPRHALLAAIFGLSLLLGTWRLGQNGYANTFYSASVVSMLRSLHNLIYASFDPGGLTTIDKPPLAIWVQVASAKLFGLHPLALLLPEALLGSLTVLVLYRVVARRLGPGAGLASALALAVFPSFVAVSRDNGVDPLLILLMVCACGATLSAIESGRRRPLYAAAVLIGLAFNTKTLAAYLVVPGMALAYLACAPQPLLARLGRLAVAGLVLGAVSFSWIALVELTPAHSRPFVGSSTHNTELGLTFEYNGFGRVGGELGGPGQIPVAAGAVVLNPRTGTVVARSLTRRAGHTFTGVGPAVIRSTGTSSGAHTGHKSVAELLAPKPPASPELPNGRLRNPIAFGQRPGPLRLFRKGLGDQGAWLLPLALAGLLAFAWGLRRPREAQPTDGAQGGPVDGATPSGGNPASAGAASADRIDGAVRRRAELAALLVLGGWFLAEAIVLSFSKGIVHPYYASALGPPAAAMVGAGCVAFVGLARRRDPRALLGALGVIATVAVQLLLLHQQRYMQWLAAPLIVLVAVGVSLMTRPRLASAGMALTLLVLVVAPTGFAASTWLAPAYGTFPAAGPHEATGEGLYGLSARNERLYRNLIAYVSSHGATRRYPLLTDASPTAAPLILMGLDAASIAGYSGTDPALDGPSLARMLAHGEARYVVLGGSYATRGGNLATKAVLADCTELSGKAWHGHKASPHTLVLFDCAGHERALAAGRRYSFL
jgi:4-amino-4-deoxy-L-arabinose transferase-like glycosyltransferase